MLEANTIEQMLDSGDELAAEVAVPSERELTDDARALKASNNNARVAKDTRVERVDECERVKDGSRATVNSSNLNGGLSEGTVL
ncbi:hypothetical protein GN244_ATG10305 [Phytophthora infestans]|uniref:Uncharacterized protein n=1 Tax=Phytophthora infestans TaxID=4787 RepID=A0A833TAL7_PHYIN|nr:hypothetical protein GN244_ATG10305 [Phytophthora infestans]